MDASPVYGDDFPGFHFPDELGLYQIQGTGLRGHHIAFFQLSQYQGSEPPGVPDGDHLPLPQKDEGIGPFHLLQGFYQGFYERALMGPGHQVDNDLCVHIGLEYGARIFQVLFYLVGVYQVAVVDHGQVTVAIIDHEGLGIDDGALPCGGIAVVAYGHGSFETGQPLGGEYLRHQAHAPFQIKVFPVGGGNARAFLSPVLKGIETQICQIGGFGMAENAYHGAFFFPDLRDQGPFHVQYLPSR